jgi:hypothetical protein
VGGDDVEDVVPFGAVLPSCDFSTIVLKPSARSAATVCRSSPCRGSRLGEAWACRSAMPAAQEGSLAVSRRGFLGQRANVGRDTVDPGSAVGAGAQQGNIGTPSDCVTSSAGVPTVGRARPGADRRQGETSTVLPTDVEPARAGAGPAAGRQPEGQLQAGTPASARSSTPVSSWLRFWEM